MDLMPDVNSGKEWAPMDLADLQNALAQGYGMEVIVSVGQLSRKRNSKLTDQKWIQRERRTWTLPADS
jgi:hypothetical protein